VPVRQPGAGDDAGPFEALRTPGHSLDSVCLIHGRLCFSGDTVLGEGSVFVPGDGGGLAAYLDGLERLAGVELDAILPGHGPVVWDPAARIAHYIAHRLERERKVLAAVEAGAATNDEILERAWDDTPIDTVPILRVAAAATLEAHLEKLRGEGRLPGPLAQPPTSPS
jgi:glyoxylase-like metal-dependent hydrolase (beta-lactamase superfamily II)